MAEIKDEAGNPWHKEEERKQNLNHGVDCAHLCIPFQCECCWLVNLEGRLPRPGLDDPLVMACRRVNLDAMAGYSRLTIAGHRRETAAILRDCE